MNVDARDSWQRALRSLKTARMLLGVDPDAAASRAFYAAFYAVSGFMRLEQKEFSRHSALEIAIHRDLVKTGRWSAERGADYTFLRRLRATGDYGGPTHVTEEDANAALGAAERILEAVASAYPDVFGTRDDNPDD